MLWPRDRRLVSNRRSWSKNDADLLEHLGRKDNQLKRRGQWVSLVEVETALLQFEGVLEAVAVAVEQRNREKGIAAFFPGRTRRFRTRAAKTDLTVKLPPMHCRTLFSISPICLSA